MKKKTQVRKKFEVEEVELSRKSPDASKAREGHSTKAKKRKELKEKRSTQKALRDKGISQSSKGTSESSSARGKRSAGSPTVVNVPLRGAARVRGVYTSVKVGIENVRGVDTVPKGVQSVAKGVRGVYTAKNANPHNATTEGTLPETGESRKKHLRGKPSGTRTIPPSKGTADGTNKPAKNKRLKKGEKTIDQKNIRTKKQHATHDKQRIARVTSDITNNIGESDEIELPATAHGELNSTALYPDRNNVEALNTTLKRIIRKGRLLRIDAKPPSIKLTRSICQMIRLGNYPEVAARAFGIQSNTFRTWVRNGFEDINSGENTPYAKFVMSVDIADAQSEVLDVEQINSAIDGWQAKAWIRERKSFQRWGMRALQLSGDINSNLTPIQTEPEITMEPQIAAEVLTALEEAGIVAQSGFEHLSGIADDTPILARATDDIESGELSE